MTKQKIKGVAQLILSSLNGEPLTKVLLDVESEVLILAMDQSDGVCQQAADTLGMNRTTLVEKRKRFGHKMYSSFPRNQRYA